MNLDKTLANLKKLHEGYTADVARLTAEVQAANEELVAASALAAQTLDAINALEGKSSLKKMLEEALQKPKSEPLDSAVGAICLAAAPSSDLPPAEKGFQWVKNAEGEYVLIPLTGNVQVAPQTPTSITLPAIDEDATFTDTPEDFIPETRAHKSMEEIENISK